MWTPRSMIVCFFAALSLASGSLSVLSACSTATVTALSTSQWNVTSVTTGDGGTVSRAEVSGFFIFTAGYADGGSAQGTFIEDVTLSGVRTVQQATFISSSSDHSLTLVTGDLVQSYTYAITSFGETQTMTWDSQDTTKSHWVLVLVNSADASADAADGSDEASD